MRIERLDLLAFGPFTDRRLVLGADEGPSLCVVHGPNEAGKSSALRAIRGLLYGIEHDSPDNFIHAHADLRVGARLRFADGEAFEVVRRKGRKQTLVGDGPSGARGVERVSQLAESVPETLFRHFYGLDHPALVEGSQQLLEDGGELARALFGAGLGIGHLRKVIESLESEAAALYVPRGNKQPIAVALADWRALKKEIRERSLDPGRHAELAARIARLESELAARERKRADDQAALARARGAREKWLELARGENEHAAVCSRIAREQERMAELVLSPALLEAREPIESLHQGLDAYRAFRDELPRREEQLAELAHRIAELGASLAGAVPESESELRRVVERAPDVRKLAAERIRAEDRFAAANEAVQEAQRALDLASAASASRPLERGATPVEAEDRAIDALARLLADARRLGSIDEESARLARECAGLGAELDRVRERLGLAGLSLEAVETLALPSVEVVEQHVRRQAEHAGRRLQNRRESELRASERRQAEEALLRLREEGRLPSEGELLAERALRDAAWASLRGSLDSTGHPEAPRRAAGESATDRVQRFERHVRHADLLADQLRSEAQRVARGAELVARVEALAGCERALVQARDDERLEGDTLEQAWRALWPAPIGEPGPPETRVGWRREVARLIERAGELRRKQDQAQEVEARRAQARDALAVALAPSFGTAGGADGDAGRPHELERLAPWIDRAERELEERTTAREQVREAARARDRAAQHLEAEQRGRARAQAERERMAGSWSEELVRLGWGEATRPEEAGARLDVLHGLFERRREHGQLARRVEQMRAQQSAFERECAALVERHRSALRTTLEGFAPDQAAVRLKRELDYAGDQATRAETVRMALFDAEHDRDALEQRLLRTRESLRSLGDAISSEPGPDPDEQATGASALDRLAAEIASLEARDERGQTERDELVRTLAEERAAMAGMDGGGAIAELAERAESRVAELRGDVVRYAELRLARQLLEQEIDAYRRANQGPLLAQAGRLFAQLSCGAYPQLASDAGEDGKARLVAVDRAGRERTVDQLSSGTRDQLFLALRLAAIETAVGRAEPMPLVADDILIEFDDERTNAALGVLAEASRANQILLFSHHRHVADRAQALGAAARVVEI